MVVLQAASSRVFDQGRLQEIVHQTHVGNGAVVAMQQGSNARRIEIRVEYRHPIASGRELQRRSSQGRGPAHAALEGVERTDGRAAAPTPAELPRRIARRIEPTRLRQVPIQYTKARRAITHSARLIPGLTLPGAVGDLARPLPLEYVARPIHPTRLREPPVEFPERRFSHRRGAPKHESMSSQNVENKEGSPRTALAAQELRQVLDYPFVCLVKVQHQILPSRTSAPITLE